MAAPGRILFLCTGNSARSIMAEAYLNDRAGGRWIAYSAGSRPAGAPHELALATLAAHGIRTQDARSKSWDEFAAPDAPVMDVVITVCDSAAAQTCPVWPRRPGAQAPQRLHWSFPDPAAATGGREARRAVFERTFADIRTRIDEFLRERAP